jgi:hypothetical protein
MEHIQVGKDVSRAWLLSATQNLMNASVPTSRVRRIGAKALFQMFCVDVQRLWRSQAAPRGAEKGYLLQSIYKREVKESLQLSQVGFEVFRKHGVLGDDLRIPNDILP